MPPTICNPPRSPATSSLPRAFTLAEIMIALAILAVGLSMAAVMFPAAVTYTEGATDDTLGRLICVNGLATARQTLTRDELDNPDSGELEWIQPDADAGWDEHYPVSDADNPDTLAGCLLLARRVPPTDLYAPDEYQLVAVAYAKRDEGNTVEARPVTAQYEADEDTGAPYLIDIDDIGSVRKGTFVVLRSNVSVDDKTRPAGSFARVLVVDRGNSRARLDRELDTNDAPADIFVFVERDGGGSIVGNTSPVMFIMSTRTSLPEGN